MKKWAIASILLLLGASWSLWAFTVEPAVGVLVDQQTNPSNSFATAASFGCTTGNTGFLNPTAEAFDTGGDNDGFELNATNAFLDDASFASNINGGGDRHRFYNYSFTINASCAIQGIEVRLDWWLDAIQAVNSIDVELSWDDGTSWTAAQTDTVESTTEHTTILGGSADTWGRTWAVAEFDDANFRVRVTSTSSGGSSQNRDFFLDWVPVKVYFSP